MVSLCYSGDCVKHDMLIARNSRFSRVQNGYLQSRFRNLPTQLQMNQSNGCSKSRIIAFIRVSRFSQPELQFQFAFLCHCMHKRLLFKTMKTAFAECISNSQRLGSSCAETESQLNLIRVKTCHNTFLSSPHL